MFRKKLSIKTIFTFIIFISCLSTHLERTYAQTISLSVSPPIMEAVIKPGEKIEQTYVIENAGNDTEISVDVYQFKEADKTGSPIISKNLKEYDPLNFKSWFEIEEPEIKLNERISLGAKEKKKIRITITPPEDITDGDYYFTLFFRTDIENTTITPNSKAAISQAEIGSNIIITITGDGKINPKPEIKEFKAPKIVDSLENITYRIEIANKGTSFFKPIGKVTVTSILGEKYVINLAPQNIIANSSRLINCINEEQIIPCRLPTKIFLGPYKATLSFQTEDKKTYEKTITTIGIPFSIMGIYTIFFLLVLLFKKLIQKNIDKAKKTL